MGCLCKALRQPPTLMYADFEKLNTEWRSSCLEQVRNECKEQSSEVLISKRTIISQAMLSIIHHTEMRTLIQLVH